MLPVHMVALLTDSLLEHQMCHHGLGRRGKGLRAYPKNCKAGFPACLDSLERLSYTFFG